MESIRTLDVLVVDDDPAAMRFVATVVAAAGHRVRESRDGLQALEMLREAHA